MQLRVLAGAFKHTPLMTTVMSEPQTVTHVLPAARDGALYVSIRGGEILCERLFGVHFNVVPEVEVACIFLYLIWGMQGELEPFLKPPPSVFLMII